ncbi:4-hydroxy-tetrahydrodipicolinate synthase [Syntrophomonas palmitatica]|uniref:4-hydroxy-tetrahydrodipicolinate synthase n=1 Tax=Syntrophomonas palmitatica TaxID=402877 RepID=UPI0006D02CA1
MMTAMITPFTDDLQVNYAKAGEIAEYLCQNGTEGLVVCGTTGESPVLSHEEKLKLFAVVRDSVGGKIPVWAGTGSNNTAAAIELSREAEKLGVDGIMLVTPYYNKPSQEGLYQHFKQIAQNISLPVMLYNIPGRSSINLLPETVARLAEVKNITAIKEASGNMDQMTQLKTLLPDDFSIYSGDDSMTLPMMALGAVGVVSIASHLVGKEMRKMIDAFVQGNGAEALNIHKKLFPIFRGLFITTNPVPLKEALNMMGMQVGGFRPPLCHAEEKELVAIKKMLIDFGLLA